MSDQPMTPDHSTPAGFYPDSQGQMRFWDGTRWTEHTQAAPVAPAPAPAKKSHTFRNVMLGFIAALVLLVGGCMALIGSAANEVDKSIKAEEAKDAEPGGPDNPLTIEPGKKFSVLGFDYAAGWKVGVDGIGDAEVTGLKVTNNRDEKDGAIVEIKFMKGNEVLALVDCSTEQIAVGQTTSVDCFSTDELPKDYDRITINDTF